MATTDLPDDTQLKRRARRRLVGAIALVLLAVIVLPMIFDAEQKPLDQDVTIQIPAQGEYTAKSQSPAPKSDAPPKMETPAVPPKAETPPPQAEPPKAEPPKPEAKAEPPKAEPPKAEPPKAEQPKAAKAEKSEKAAKSDAEKAREKAEAARALALLNGEGTVPKSEKADKADKGTESYAIQIGAFSTDEKVQEVRDKLNGAGLKSYVEKVSTQSGSVTRVRAGPFASKDAAESARAKIAGLGFSSATVVHR